MKYAMKQGWKIMKLGEVCDIINGRNQKAVECADGQYPIYGSGGNVMGYASDYLCEAGTTIIGRKGSINNPIYIDTKFWNVDTAFGISSKPMMSSKFVYYFCKSFDFSKLNKGTTLPSLVKKDLLLIDIPAPSLSEQQRIVALLDAEFAKIDALKANAEKNLQNAKDLFQAALKKELEPKEGWKVKRIEEIAEIKGGKRVPKGYKLITEKTPHPYIRVSDFNDNGSVDLGDIHYIEDWVYDEIQRYTISIKDVYVSIAGTIGKSGIIPIELESANLTENACKLVLNQGFNNRYVYYCTINEPFKSQIAKLTMQAAQPKLALTRLATVTIYVPSLEDQQSIVSRLDTLNEKCKALQANYEKTLSLCDDLKQALLRKAFNGEI